MRLQFTGALLAFAMLLALPSANSRAADSNDAFAALVAAAKAEGSVVVDGPPTDAVRLALTEGFQKKYGIPVSYIGSGGGPSGARVRAERAAGKYLLDVLVSGSDTPIVTFLPSGWLDQIEPALIEPDVVNPKNWQDGHLWYADPQHMILRTHPLRARRGRGQHEARQAARNSDVALAARSEVEGQAAHQGPAALGHRPIAEQLLLHQLRARFRQEAVHRPAAGVHPRHAAGRAMARARHLRRVGRPRLQPIGTVHQARVSDRSRCCRPTVPGCSPAVRA